MNNISTENKLLGKQVKHPDSYCPEILVAVPRSANRIIYGITESKELFCGYDVWNAYECSFLLDNGLPVSGIIKIIYQCTNEFIVESKSLKLYLGSFNMTKMGDSYNHAIDKYITTLKEDISKLLKTDIQVRFISYKDYSNYGENILDNDFQDYLLLENNSKIGDTQFSIYKENPNYLAQNFKPAGEIKVSSNLLKSNCKITGQPDWGSIYIRLKADKLPDKVNLLKYIVSLRNENHFHEEICEMTYKRLFDVYHPEILMVACRYTRRGGIDINPCRANKETYLPKKMINLQSNYIKSFRQ